jgi:DNA-binding transcriptional LysR family regulator
VNTVLSQFQESVNVIRDAGRFNKCCFGTNVTVAETCLAGLLSKISSSLPDLSVKVIIRNSYEIEKMLLRNDIDFAVVDNITALSSFMVTPLFKDRMAVLCRKDYTLKDEMTLNELSREKLILREKGSCARTCIDSVFQAKSLTVDPFIESVSTLSLFEFVKNGLGITILPEALVKNTLLERYGLKCITVTDTAFERDYFVICHKNKFLTSCMKSVIEIIKSEINK